MSETGVLLQKYRMGGRSTDSKVGDYLPCEFCLATYYRHDLWKHQKICKAKPSNFVSTKGRPQASGRLLLPSSDTSLSHILVTMKDDEITHTIQRDQVIRKFGENLQEKYSGRPHLKNVIAQKMRELARLVLITPKIQEGLTDLKKLLRPENFDAMKKCVKLLSGHDENTGCYENPSLAMKLGTSLRKCAEICRVEAIKRNDTEGQRQAQQYIELHDAEFGMITIRAKSTLDDRKYNKTKQLPLFEDVVTLDRYLNKQASACENEPKNQDTYVRLAKINLARVILFNRKRSGEAERITIANYKEGLLDNDAGHCIQSHSI